MKTCPFCAEEIQDAAIKCRHCGSMLGNPVTEMASARPTAGNVAAVSPGVGTTIFQGKPSWKAQFWSVLTAVILAASGVALAPILHTSFEVAWEPALIGAAVLFALGVGWLLFMWGARATQRFHVTTRAIDIESGLLSKSIETLQLWKVRDIEFRQTVTDRLLGVARIRILTHDVTSPETLLWGLPGSPQLFEQLKEALEIARQSRNVIGLIE